MKKVTRLSALMLCLAVIASVMTFSAAVTSASADSSNFQNFTFTGIVLPTQIKQGRTFITGGIVESRTRWNLMFIRVSIQGNGLRYTEGLTVGTSPTYAKGYASKYNLLGVDHKLHFEKLPVGYYNIIVEARDHTGHHDVVYVRPFTVVK